MDRSEWGTDASVSVKCYGRVQSIRCEGGSVAECESRECQQMCLGTTCRSSIELCLARQDPSMSVRRLLTNAWVEFENMQRMRGTCS